MYSVGYKTFWTLQLISLKGKSVLRRRINYNGRGGGGRGDVAESANFLSLDSDTSTYIYIQGYPQMMRL